MKTAAERAFAARAKPADRSDAQPLAKAVAQPARLAMTAARPVQTCAPEALEASAKQCAAMDASNKELTGKLVDLEGKVKQLQKALAEAPAAASPAGTATAAAAGVAAGATALANASAAAVAHGSAAKTSPAASAPVVDAATSAKEAGAEESKLASATAHSASGPITDARPAQAASAPEPSAKPSAEASRPIAADKASKKSKAEEKQKKLSRPKLIGLISAGIVGLLTLIGLGVHFGGKLRARTASRAQDAEGVQAEAENQVAEAVAEAPVAVASQE